MKLNKFIKKIYGSEFSLHVIAMFLMVFIGASAQFIMTYYLGLIIDAVQMGLEETINNFIIIIFAITIFIVCSAIINYVSGKMGIRLSYLLRFKIAEKICSAKYEEIEKISEGELLSIATKDIEGINNWLITLLKLGNLPAQLGLVLIFAFRLNWKFSLCTLCLIPLAAIPEILISRNLGSYFAKEKEAHSEGLAFFTNTIELLIVIKSFQLEGLFQKKNAGKTKKYKENRLKSHLHERMTDIYSRCFGHITNPLLLLLGAIFIINGELSLGKLTSVIFLASFVGEGLKTLNEVPARLHEGRASANRIEKLLNMQTEPSQDYVRKIPQEDIIYEVKDLSFRYREVDVLKNIKFRIKRGEKIAVIGPSGAGKTTLFKLLSGLYLPCQGCVCFQGEDITKIPLEYLRKSISVVTQESFIFNATFKDNIKLADLNGSDERLILAAKHAQIDSFIKTFEHGYDTVVNTTVRSMSNGQMQRINLARAFFKNTDVFLFDEPTSALDTDLTTSIFELLFSEYKDKTVLMILHNMQELYRFDKILLLNNGEVEAFGSHKELLNDCDLYEKLYRQEVN